MSKHKSGKRLNKKMLVELLQTLFQQNPNESFSFKQIFKNLKLSTHPAKMLAVETMDEMAWDDYLTKTSENSYRLNLKNQVQEGTFIRKANGKNSFQPDDGGKPIFVSERNSLFAMNGDRVRVAMMARREKHIKEAMVIEILSHKVDQAVGKLKVEKDFAFLVTEGNIFVHDILIPKKKLKGGKDGEKAVVRITQWPSKDSKNIVGEVIDVLGKEGDNNVEMHAILAQYGLPYKYPKHVEDAAEKMDPGITEQEIKRREDFRDVFTCTIDPKDAKDFDDALSIRKQGRLWEVGVHIADVSHYVTEGSVIDKEAQQRGTSVYLVDRTIPMLPEKLCNGVCSLRPHEDKLCFSAVFEMNDRAEVLHRWFGKTLINSDRRYCYEEAQQVIDTQTTGVAAPDGTVCIPADEAVLALHRLATILREARYKEGAINFESQEVKFQLDENAKPIGVYIKEQKEANWLIEEFMLLANRNVAESIGKPSSNDKGGKGKRGADNGKATKSAPKTFVYRVHDEPNPEKLNTFVEFVAKLGFKMRIGSRKALADSYNHLFQQIAGRGEEYMIDNIAIRTMSKAYYSTENIGHYGLAFPFYTHFTSPIRRYPDLMVHRLLERYLEGGASANADEYEEYCKHCSLMEKKAADAERSSVKYKQAEYLSDKLGQVFNANISGVSKWGLYAEIEGNKCEGMIPIGSLKGDYYMLDEDNYQVIGRRYGNSYKLGDPVRIRVRAVNMLKKQIDFDLVEEEDAVMAPTQPKSGSRTKSKNATKTKTGTRNGSKAKTTKEAPSKGKKAKGAGKSAAPKKAKSRKKAQ